jgi:VIT1/CCC1 family predicted Fe2+/Mn2+ transporter
MMFTAILVNILLGTIDGLTVIFGSLVDDVAEDEAVKALRAGVGISKDVIDGFDDSLVGVLDGDDKLEIAEIIRTSGSHTPMKAKIGRDHFLRFLAIFSIDFFAVFWVILPYMLTTDVVVAARVSFAIATCIMFYLGYKWAKYARMRRWAIGVGFSLFTLALLAISY